MPAAEEITDLFSSSESAGETEPEEAEPESVQPEDIIIPDDEDEEDVTVEQAQPIPEPVAPAAPQPPTEAEEKPLSSFTTAEKDGVLLDGGMIFETDDYRSAGNDAYITDDEESDFYIAPEKLRRSHTRRNNELYAPDADENRYYHIDDEQPELPRSFFKENLALIIVLAALLIITAVLCYCIFVVPAKSGVASGEYLRNIFDTLLGRQ